MRFAGKPVVVTGSRSGIGNAIALRFARDGAKVLSVDHFYGWGQPTSGSDDIIRYQADVADETSVQEMIFLAARKFGHIDTIVANDSILGNVQDIFDQGASDSSKTLRINLIGTFLAIKHGAKAMTCAGCPGAVICTASIAGLRSGAGGLAYSAQKDGVIKLLQNAAHQLSGSGIRINAVCPGLIETEMTRVIYQRARSSGKEHRLRQINPLWQGGQPDEVAS